MKQEAFEILKASSFFNATHDTPSVLRPSVSH
jgi:hypothetical protein